MEHRSSFQQNVLKQLHIQVQILDFCKNYLKMDHRLECKMQNSKLLEGNIRENRGDIRFGDLFRCNTKSVIHERKKKNSMTLSRSKTPALHKDIVKRMKRQVTKWEKMYAKHMSDERHIQNMQRTLESQQLRKFKNGKRSGQDTSPKKIYR